MLKCLSLYGRIMNNFYFLSIFSHFRTKHLLPSERAWPPDKSNVSTYLNSCDTICFSLPLDLIFRSINLIMIGDRSL